MASPLTVVRNAAWIRLVYCVQIALKSRLIEITNIKCPHRKMDYQKFSYAILIPVFFYSFGGGCCDCGDIEAWKKEYYCEDHAPVNKDEIDSLITDEMKDICRIVFRGILSYCVTMLQIDSDSNFPNIEEEANQTEDIYCTLLYNDETHTFDQVRIKQLNVKNIHL